MMESSPRGHRAQGITVLKVALMTIAVTCALNASAQTPVPSQVNVPAGVDPNDDSGWLKVEVAVLIDDRASVLNGEYWPPFPDLRYPPQSRWLIDPQKVSALRAGYPLANAQQNDLGAITVSVPDPLSVIAEAVAEREAVEGSADPDVTEAFESTADERADTEASAPQAIPLELIDAEPEDTRASVDWLQDFQTVAPPVADEAETFTFVEGEDEPPREPVLPSPFAVQPVKLLAPGLQSLVRNNPDRLELQVSWLQPPNAPNLPIILDDSGDSEEWPPLQGFVELRRGNPLRLGVNFWWNTDAAYYPETYSMSSPPRGPKQVTLLDALNQRPLSSEEAVDRAQQLASIIEAREAGKPFTEYVDPDTGFFIRKQPPKNVEVAAVEDPRAWPWRHAVQVADTRAVPEGAVRYYDHPVVKVVATWRSLTWGEVYQLGEQERQAAEAEAVIEAGENARDRASAVAP